MNNGSGSFWTVEKRMLRGALPQVFRKKEGRNRYPQVFGMAETAKTAAIAKQMGLDPSGVRRVLRRAADEGRIATVAGQWPVAAAIAILQAEVDPARVAGHNANMRGNHDAPEVSTLSKARAEAEIERARKLKIDNAKRAGELVSLSDVRQAGADIVIRARSAFLSLGDRVADKLVGLSDRSHIEKAIAAEAREILSELADPNSFVDSILGDGA